MMQERPPVTVFWDIENCAVPVCSLCVLLVMTRPVVVLVHTLVTLNMLSISNHHHYCESH
jgi:hypothetical protein